MTEAERKRTVLLVDDYEDFLFQHRLHLERAGFNALVAHGQKEAERCLPSCRSSATMPAHDLQAVDVLRGGAMAGWMNRQQQEVIEYLREENRVLREKLGHKRIILNESQKRRLATAAMKLGKDLLAQFGTLFSPRHAAEVAPLVRRPQVRRL